MASLVDRIIASGQALQAWADDNGVSRGACTLELVAEIDGNAAGAPRVVALRNRLMAVPAPDCGSAETARFLGVATALYALANKPDGVIAAKAVRAVSPLLAAVDGPSHVCAALVRSIAETQVPGKKGFSCGSLARYVAVAAALTGFHCGDAFMEWAAANAELLCEGIPNRASRWLAEALEADGCPRFDLARTQDGGKAHVRKMYFDTDSRFCRDLLRSSVDDEDDRVTAQTLIDPFFQEFEASIGFAPESLSDFTVDVFDRQARWFEGKGGPYDASSTYRFMRRFYQRVCSMLPPGQRQFSVETGLTPSMLHHHTLFKYWNQGFRAVVHNPLDPPPANPRWFLVPSDDEVARTNVRPEPWVVDLSYPVPELERLIVGWIWTECENVAGMRRIPSLLREYMRLVEAAGRPWRASNASVVKFMAAKEHALDRSGIRHVKGWLRSFLRYAQETGTLSVDPSCLMLLSVSEKSRRWQPDEGAAVPPDDLKRVLDHLDAKSEGDAFCELMYAALCTQSLTPLRIGDILDLRRSDLVAGPDGTTASVEVSTKTDGYARRGVQVPRSVGELLDAAAALTRELAERALPEVADYIFLYQGHARAAVKKIRVYELTRRLKEACDEAGVERFTPRNIRRRYETEVVVQGVRRNIGRLALKPLTGHASLSVTERHYVRDGIREYLQAVHGIEIGQPLIKGEVVDSVPGELACGENAVEGGAGFCRNSECNVAGTVTCLMCPGFVTEPGCIPEMEEAVALVNAKIAECGEGQHDRGHLMSVKRLYLGYLAVMYEMREAKIHAR